MRFLIVESTPSPSSQLLDPNICLSIVFSNTLACTPLIQETLTIWPLTLKEAQAKGVDKSILDLKWRIMGLGKNFMENFITLYRSPNTVKGNVSRF